MVAVSERAKKILLEQKRAANIDDADVGLRVAAAPAGQWMLVVDEPRDDDQVVEYDGATVLLVDPEAQSALVGTEVDCVETPEGAVELVLTAPTRTRTKRTKTRNDDELDDDGSKVYGIVTDRDIVVRGIAEGLDPRTNTLDDICSRTLTTVSPDDSIDTAVSLMREKAIRRLPVVKRGRPVGIVSIGDLAIERDSHSALADVSAAPPNA